MPISTNEYDAIIIGSGVGGLVCGCYLAKAGLKCIIVEQHNEPGGYCTSFFRKGYKFDSSIHAIGGIRHGVMNNILKELDFNINHFFSQMDPTDKVIMPHATTYIRAHVADTIMELEKSFTSQKNNIRNFFKFITSYDLPALYRKFYKLNFNEFLNSLFTDPAIKSSIGALLLGNMGLPPRKISALTAIVFFKEFLVDPGYYPKGGMNNFALYLADFFKAHKGTLLLNHKVTSITTLNNTAKGITAVPVTGTYTKEINISGRFVISNADATQTFTQLINGKPTERHKVEQLLPSKSIFAVYLGLDTHIKTFTDESCNIWYFNTFDLDNCYNKLENNINHDRIKWMMITFPSSKEGFHNMQRSTAEIFTMAPYDTYKFWQLKRNILCEQILNTTIELFPHVKNHVDIVTTATPHTFERYTLNKEGAAFGWASTIKQSSSSTFPQITSIKNLYLAGHWTTMGGGQGGVSTVALSGKKAAMNIINKVSP